MCGAAWGWGAGGSADFGAAPVEAELGPEGVFVAGVAEAVPVVLEADGDGGGFVEEEASGGAEAEAVVEAGVGDAVGVFCAEGEFEGACEAGLVAVEGVGVDTEVGEGAALWGVVVIGMIVVIGIVVVVVFFFVVMIGVVAGVIVVFLVIGVIVVVGRFAWERAADGAEAAEHGFGAPAEVVAAWFEAIFAPFVFSVEAVDVGGAIELVIAPCAGGSEAEPVEIVDLDEIGPVGGEEEVFEGGSVGLEGGFFVFVFVGVAVVVVIDDGVTSGEGEGALPWDGEVPCDFAASGGDAVVAEELIIDEETVGEVPAVEVGGVVEAEAVEELAAAEFEATGEGFDFEEGFVVFVVPA